MEIHSWDTAPRVDAQASEVRSGIGGWAPVRNTEGELDPWLSPWFSYELTRKDWPWIYERGDRPSLVISTLEALAVLIQSQVILRRRTQERTDQSTSGSDVDRQSRERVGIKQINVDQVSLERCGYGALLLSQTHVSEGVSRMGSAYCKLRSRFIGEWRDLWLRPLTEN